MKKTTIANNMNYPTFPKGFSDTPKQNPQKGSKTGEKFLLSLIHQNVGLDVLIMILRVFVVP